MEDLPGEIRVDPQVVIDHLRSIIPTGSYPRSWLPQATFDELQVRADREPIHLNPALHHLHRRWDMVHARTAAHGGRRPRAIARRLLSRLVNTAFEQYFTEEQEFRAALAQSIDAIAYRVDEVSTADLRSLLELVRADLLDLARHLDERLDERLVDIQRGARLDLGAPMDAAPAEEITPPAARS